MPDDKKKKGLAALSEMFSSAPTYGGGKVKVKPKTPLQQRGSKGKMMTNQWNTINPRQADGDRLGENIFEFVDPTGVSSWDDVYRSAKTNGVTSSETLKETMGALPFVGSGKKIVKGLQKGSKIARGSAIANSFPVIGRALDTVDDVLNLGTKKKYLTGGSVKSDYMTNPLQALYEDQMNKTKADATAGAGFLPNFLQTIGPMLGQAVSSGAFGGLPKAATGGSFEDMQAINAEGGEVVESPDGEVMKLKGPSHESGGIDLAVPGGTDIYSKRIKGPDGKTMAERKKARTDKLKEFEKKLEKNPGDVLLKKSYSRMKQAFDMADEQDVATMNAAREEEEGVPEFADGGTVMSMLQRLLQQQGQIPDMQNLMATSGQTPGVTPTAGITGGITGGGYSEPVTQDEVSTGQVVTAKPEKSWLDSLGGLGVSAGDVIGMAGNFMGSMALNKNIKDSMNNIPNVNAFKDFGKEGLQENQNVINSLKSLRDDALRDLTGRSNTQRANLRGNARGVNQMRAGDLAVGQAEEQATNNVNNTFTNQMMNALAQRSGLLTARDQQVMTGEQAVNLANQQDLTAAQGALATGRLNNASTMSKVGGTLNRIKERSVTDKLQQELTNNISVDQNGNIIGKGYTIPKAEADSLRDAGKLAEFDTAKEQGYNVTAKYGKIYYTGTNIEYNPNDPDPDFMNPELDDQAIEDNYIDSGFDTLEFEEMSPENYLDYTDGELKGSKLYSGLKMDNVSNILNVAAQDYGQPLDLDNEASVKAFQDWLGLKDKKADGKVGNDTIDAIIKKMLPENERVKPNELSSTTPVPTTKKYFEGVTKTQASNVKQRLKATESAGGTDLRTSSAGAKGAYQIIWSHNKDNIRKALGNITEQQFNSSPKLQEEYMDYAVQQYAKKITPKVQQAINNVFPDMSKEDMIMLYHYEPAIINGISEGRITSLNHVPGTVDHTNKTIGYYLYGAKRPKGVLRTGKGIRKGKKK